MKTQKREKADALRKKAEKEAARKSFPDAHLKRKSAAELIQELRVHQIELEMQNDELRNAQAALAESHQKYSDLYNLAPVGYLTLDDEGIVREANLAAAALLDTPRDALVNKPFHLRVEPGDQDVFFLHRQKVFKEKTIQRCEISVKRRDGKPITVQMESAPAGEAAGLPSAFRCAVTDITAIKEASEALHVKNEELERFNRAMIDRELRIVELKKLVNELDAQAGRQPRYKLDFMENRKT